MKSILMDIEIFVRRTIVSLFARCVLPLYIMAESFHSYVKACVSSYKICTTILRNSILSLRNRNGKTMDSSNLPFIFWIIERTIVNSY